jgi:NADPH-dependent 7-cyano-7-deazaguanine reductase QueF
VVSFREYGEKQIPSYIISLQQLDILHEEWYNIALESIQNLLESITRRIEAVL